MQVKDGVSRLAIATGAVALFALPALAQWINYPTPGIPRTPDGKPDLAAPAPRTADGKPDLSGLWQPASGGPDPQFVDIAKEAKDGLPFQKWAADLVKARRAENNKDDPDGHCQPLGTVKMHLHPYPRKILQLPGLMVILYERDTVTGKSLRTGVPCRWIHSRPFTGIRLGSGKATRWWSRPMVSRMICGSISVVRR